MFQTQRLTIRPFEPKDCNAYLEAYRNRLPSQNAFDAGFVGELSKKYFYDFLETTKVLKAQDKIYILGAFNSQTGQLIGILEFVIYLRSAFNWGSFGVSLHNQFFGQGYGNELTSYAEEIAKILGIKRLECAIEEGNTPSIAMTIKAGYEFECIRKSFCPTDNGLIDMKIYYKLLN